MPPRPSTPTISYPVTCGSLPSAGFSRGGRRPGSNFVSPVSLDERSPACTGASAGTTSVADRPAPLELSAGAVAPAADDGRSTVLSEVLDSTNVGMSDPGSQIGVVLPAES